MKLKRFDEFITEGLKDINELGKLADELLEYFARSNADTVDKFKEDEKYNDIKQSVGETLELFKTIVVNFDSFKQTPDGKEGKLDLIIDRYKEFIKNIADKLKNLGDK